MKSPLNSGLFKTGGKVAFRQARRGARRGNEEVEISRGVDCIHATAGRVGHAGSRCVSSDRRVPSDLLHVEEEVRCDLGVTELKSPKILEGETAGLKRIVADLTLDKQILQEVVREKR